MVEQNQYMTIQERIRRQEFKNSKEFQQALLYEFGVSNNPKANLCFMLAWEYGHAGGYEEVVGYFTELVELISTKGE